jgi:hypothetical protein
VAIHCAVDLRLIHHRAVRRVRAGAGVEDAVRRLARSAPLGRGGAKSTTSEPRRRGRHCGFRAFHSFEQQGRRMNDTMQAFHADPAIKQEFLDRLHVHAEAGAILNRASVWNDGKGGPVACMVHDTDLAVWQQRTGIPKAVGSALDIVASYLAEPEQAARFVLEWVEAVEVGQDLRTVAPALLEWLLADGEHGIHRLVEHESPRRMISRVADLHRRAAADDTPDEAEWRATRAVAMAATDACENNVEKSIAATAEAAAWNPATSATVVSDTVRAWVNLFGPRTPPLVGRGATLNQEIKAWIEQLKADAEKAGLAAPNISERDLCVTHPAAVALKRMQMEQIKQARRQDRQRLAEVLLALTWQSAAASIGV